METKDVHFTVHPHRGEESAFTLVELLLVAILLSLLSIATTKVVSGVRFASHDAHQAAEGIRKANTVFRHMQDTFNARGNNGLQSMQGGPMSRVAFSQTYIEYLPTGSGSEPLLRFSGSSSNFPDLNDPRIMGDVEVRYYLEGQDRDRALMFELWSNRSTNNAFNQQAGSPISALTPPAPDEAPTPLFRREIVRGIKNFAMRFKTPQGWSEDTKAVYGFTPSLVEVSIELPPEQAASGVVLRTALRIGKGLR